MTSIIEKRRSLHRHLASQQQENSVLRAQLSRLEALANIGKATCMIAHEINNLLTPLASYAALALENINDKALVEKALQKTITNCRSASRVMESILAVANGQTQEKKDVQLRGLVEEVFSCLCRDFARDAITVNIRIPEDLEIRAVPVQIQQVLMNLILNARSAMLPRGGSLTIRAEPICDAVRIEVADTGCGIDPANLERIFEPFFTKAHRDAPAGHSSAGLGLAFCKEIVDAHGGRITVDSQQAKGTTFTIILPRPH